MTKRIVAALIVLAVAVPMYADFGAVARAIDAEKGVKRIWIPFLGVARLAVRIVHPEGVRDFQLVTFEGADNVDPSRLQQVMQEKLGKGFVPLVRVWSKKGGKKEWSFIYVRPHGGDRIELVILAHDDEDTALVRVDVDAEMLARELDEPVKVTRMGRH
jgi:hypothetical protein